MVKSQSPQPTVSCYCGGCCTIHFIPERPDLPAIGFNAVILIPLCFDQNCMGTFSNAAGENERKNERDIESQTETRETILLHTKSYQFLLLSSLIWSYSLAGILWWADMHLFHGIYHTQTHKKHVEACTYSTGHEMPPSHHHNLENNQ